MVTVARDDGRQRLIDQDQLRRVLGNFCTGVTVITAVHDGAPQGFACQSVTSLSLDPPFVSFCPAKSSRSWPLMRDAGTICVNVLSHDQLELCRRFATSGAGKFDGTAWEPGGNGAPALNGTLARIEADVEFEHDAGDHTIVIARVSELEVHRQTDPLLFFRGGYGSFVPAHGAGRTGFGQA
ncbi:flavin reductase family protein [Tomitella fengzijianii]|uniref:Flavin reductase family protein n=1 Tax=Tomitella fengzijianii TaxID=2597660 RepID=A0A516X711_9ACTN|nr:flavin reductase family protein [Tomitella fengzijianii]QDQ98857.1 flavin reductase family protein [Tomitella fengzijianii]